MYNIGFAVFTVASILLAVTWMNGTDAALWLIIWRIVQGIGGAFLFANSTAILTDAFPANQRGTALGMNAIAAIAGSFSACCSAACRPVDWHLVFLGLGAVRALRHLLGYLMLHDLSERHHARIDWWGNILFAAGLVAILVGITYGLEPYGGHAMGWTSPFVLSMISGGLAALAVFCFVETRVPEPMFRLSLFRDPRVRGRQPGQPDDRPGPGRDAVHPHHLAAGDLAAAARLQLLARRRCGPAST